MRKHLILRISVNVSILFILFPLLAFAEWNTPKEIVSGKWGSQVGEFYFEPQDTEDSFPMEILIDQNGIIIIRDEGNFRILIYNLNGQLKNIIKKPNELPALDSQYYWPLGIKLLNNNLIAVDCDAQKDSQGKLNIKKCLLNYKGKIVNKLEWAEMIPVNNGFFLKKGEIYQHYLNSGQLLKTYDTIPLELGTVETKTLTPDQSRATVKYPDKEWTVILDKLGCYSCAGFIRDSCSNLYYAADRKIARFNDNGDEIARLVMSKTTYQKKPLPPNFPPNAEPPKSVVLEEYGSPILAPNGDVYTWKRTPDKYSIIKWVWVDGPECPQYLDVTPTKNSLKFTWQKPTKDADKVTGYQLLQSYNICGPFRQTALLKKDQLSYEDRDVKKGETYYYIVKAVRGKDYSGNSNKVCGQLE